MRGIGASPGIEIGKVYQLVNQDIKIEEQNIKKQEVEEEIERLQGALQKVKMELKAIKEHIEEELGPDKARIFEAHIMLLDDPELIPAIEEKIRKQHLRAEKAVDEVMDHYINIFKRIENKYLEGRKSDVRDVGHRLIKELISQEQAEHKLQEEVIIVARDLTPADTARLDTSVVKAFVTEQGSRTSHSAIMARSLGIPAVVGVGDGFMEKCHSGDIIAVDGTAGEVVVEPEEDVLRNFRERKAEFEKHQQDLIRYRDSNAVTEDGKKIEVVGNIGDPDEVDSVLENGGEGIGLFRTEFLYMNRSELPSEEEQFQVYRRVAEKMGSAPVIIRTLDIGGGKNLPYFEMTEEENPFLGYRAIRISLEKTEIFKDQLRAILRAGKYGNIKIMFPMISSLEELRAAKRLMEESRRELREEGLEFAEQIESGIMIEIPSTLMIAGELAREVDFFSIGTNDLIQYMLAVDRNNEKIARMHSPFHPAVLRFISRIVAQAHENNIWVGMCGEAAGNDLLIPFWLGIGLDELSMSAISILQTKKLISSWRSDDALQVAEKALSLTTSDEIKEYLSDIRGGKSID